MRCSVLRSKSVSGDDDASTADGGGSCLRSLDEVDEVDFFMVDASIVADFRLGLVVLVEVIVVVRAMFAVPDCMRHVKRIVQVLDQRLSDFDS